MIVPIGGCGLNGAAYIGADIGFCGIVVYDTSVRRGAEFGVRAVAAGENGIC